MFQLNNISINKDDRQILKINNLSLKTKELTFVLGHNGSGKSTLVKLLSGQLKTNHEKVLLDDKPLKDYSSKNLAKRIAYLPQYLPQAPGLTVRELVKLGRFPWRGFIGRWRPEDQAIIQSAMEQTSIADYANTPVDFLSGGERQRAWIAMLLAQQSDLLILDEPTAALDIAHQYELLSLLKELHSQGHGVIVVLHDINLALRFANHILAMRQGEVFFNGQVADFADKAVLSSLFDIDVSLIDHPFHPGKVAII